MELEKRLFIERIEKEKLEKKLENLKKSDILEITAEQAREEGKKKRIKQIFRDIEHNVELFRCEFNTLTEEELGLLKQKGFKIEENICNKVVWSYRISW